MNIFGLGKTETDSKPLEVGNATLVSKQTIVWKKQLPDIDSRDIFWKVIIDPLSQAPLEQKWFVAQEYRMGSAGLLVRKLKGGK